MRTLPEVEEARAVMTEAMGWSVMRWLREKKRVRKMADKANAALNDLNQAVKAHWSHEIRTAYIELSQPGSVKRPHVIPAEIRQFVEQVKEADDQAYRARMDAERTFDEAERLLSTSLAREGCRKAIRSWDLHEKAIRRAEA
ncbi:MAG TPA: hypothetical protein VGF08_00390 [Terriglobales bacterium]